MKQKFFFILFKFLMKIETFQTIVNRYAENLIFEKCSQNPVCDASFEKKSKRKYTKRKKQ